MPAQCGACFFYAQARFAASAHRREKGVSMFLNLLAMSVEDIITYCIIGAVALLAVIVVAICLYNRNKKMDTKAIAYAAVCLAASFVLSFIKAPAGPFGGSITLASFVPVLIYVYAYGAIPGFFVGIIFGLLNYISGPWWLTPFTFLFDYVLAFAMIGVFGFFRKMTKSHLVNICVGVAAMFIARFLMHFFAGIIYFDNGIIADGLPATNAYLYSFVYQMIYLPADAAISLVVLIILERTGMFARLLNLVNPAQFSLSAAKTSADTADATAEIPKSDPTHEKENTK